MPPRRDNLELLFLPAAILISATTLVFALDSKTIATNLFVDDAFYYFTTARNFARGLGSTFDGIHPTNGYHPLWFLMLSALTKIASNGLLLKLILMLQALLFAAGTAIGQSNLRRAGISKSATGFSFLALVFLAPFLLKTFLSGMECSLAWLLLNALIAQSFNVFEKRTAIGHLLLGILIGLAFLARLDTFPIAFVIGIIWICDCFRTNRRREASLILVAALPASAIAGLYLCSNSYFFDTPFTVSSLIKMGVRWQVGAIDIAILIVGFLPLAYLLWRRRKFGTSLNGLLTWTAGNLAIVAMIFVVSPTQLTRAWFLVPELLLGWAGLSFALDDLLGRFNSLRQQSFQIALAALLIVVNARLCFIVLAPVRYQQWSYLLQFAEKHTRDLPREVILAGFDIGRVGFYLDRKMICLDGLVNSLDFVEVCREGRLLSYLRQENVGYLLNFSLTDQPLLQARLLPCGPGEDWQAHAKTIESDLVYIEKRARNLRYELIEILK